MLAQVLPQLRVHPQRDPELAVCDVTNSNLGGAQGVRREDGHGRSYPKAGRGVQRVHGPAARQELAAEDLAREARDEYDIVGGRLQRVEGLRMSTGAKSRLDARRGEGS